MAKTPNRSRKIDIYVFGSCPVANFAKNFASG